MVIDFLINNKTWRKKKFLSFPLLFLINFVSAEKCGDIQEIFPVQDKEEKRVFTWANIDDPAKTVDQFFSIFCL